MIAVAGAGGFVGSALGRALAGRGPLVALTRGPSRPAPAGSPYRELRSCDLYSLLEAEHALEGARTAVYLVHSMMPSARLTQGSFRDMDLLCADNFARAARKAGVEQIVYLGGLIPPAHEAAGTLSPHLASRLEVERALASHGVPLTTLRASLVVGGGGSSFVMMQRLVRRLPAMLLPRWTRTLTQPVALADVVALLASVIGDRATFGQTYDVGGPDVMSYRDMLARTAQALGVRRRLIGVPFGSPGLSRLWVSLITGAPRELVAPLVESLRSPMVAGDRRLQERLGRPGLSFEAAVRSALKEEQALPARAEPVAYRVSANQARKSDVRSVQRLPLPTGHDAAWVARAYLDFLPRLLRSFLRVEVSEERVARFFVPVLRRPLLELSHAPERSTPDRQLFYITGGALTVPGARGRFEFREVVGGHVLAAIHAYEPRLPWFVYRLSQALVHRWVMWRFALRLRAAQGASA